MTAAADWVAQGGGSGGGVSGELLRGAICCSRLSDRGGVLIEMANLYLSLSIAADRNRVDTAPLLLLPPYGDIDATR